MLIGDIYRRLYVNLFSKPTNFKWVIDSKLVGSGFINSKKALSFLIDNDVKAILTLTTSSLPSEVLLNKNIIFKHIPIVDHSLPSIDQFNECVDFIFNCLDDNLTLLVHCRAGVGRTGSVFAAYFIKKGFTTEESIKHIRKLRPGSIENRQIPSLKSYYNYLLQI